jgi:hypothetical protein
MSRSHCWVRTSSRYFRSSSRSCRRNLATFSLTAKGTWGQFLAFVDAIERYPGVVSLGGALELPFLGGKAGADVLNVPIKFYMNSPNDPSWMIQKGGFAVIAPPAGPSAAPTAP